jgi:hypothetical protein
MFISKFSTNLKTSSKLSKVSFVFKRSRADIFETFGDKEKTTNDRSTQKGMKKKKDGVQFCVGGSVEQSGGDCSVVQ